MDFEREDGATNNQRLMAIAEPVHRLNAISVDLRLAIAAADRAASGTRASEHETISSQQVQAACGVVSGLIAEAEKAILQQLDADADVLALRSQDINTYSKMVDCMRLQHNASQLEPWLCARPFNQMQHAYLLGA